MTDPTALDLAHAAMVHDLDDDRARLGFYGTLADTELFLVLEEEPHGSANLRPEILDLDGAPYALVFDREERLTDFAREMNLTRGQATPYAALPGRVIAGMLAGMKAAPRIGLGVNLGVAPSSILIPAEAMDWLSTALAQEPERASARPVGFSAPANPEHLARALTTKLEGRAGLGAWLVEAQFDDGSQALTLAFIGAAPHEFQALARAAQEAAAFGAGGVAQFATIHLGAEHPQAAAIIAAGYEVALPAPAPKPDPAPPAPPGSDPNKPPNLR